MEQGFRNAAQRIVNAGNKFKGHLTALGFSQEQANKIFEVYKKARVIKLDAVNGEWKVKHGAFFDIEVLNRALVA